MDRVCHFEVPYADKKRAEKFYKSVFGWQFSDYPGDMPYAFAITTDVDEHMTPKTPGGINGGFYPRGDEGGSKTPVIVIEVASCEKRIKDVQAAGGAAVMGPFPVGDMGIYAQVKDSESNIIGLWQQLTPGEAATSAKKTSAKQSKPAAKPAAKSTKSAKPGLKSAPPAKKSPAAKKSATPAKKKK